MIQSRNGVPVTLSNRAEAHESVDKQKRYEQIIECLNERPKMTAKQIAVMMFEKGYIPNTERNFTAPRLTELSQQGVVEPIGKIKCEYTGKSVAVYQLRKEEIREQGTLGLFGEPMWWWYEWKRFCKTR